MPKSPTGAKRSAEATHNSNGPKAIDDGDATPPGSAKRILDWARRNAVSPDCQRTAEEIDAGIRAERHAWD
ncbi:MAG TPA: hypothetical protein VHW69_03015 [Rhizomicrobium sp.]|jgi:hypothetical protein|nr:hypothetical protein [Rhizomicrobium sp.]